MYKLEIKDLHKSYGTHEVLKGVSLEAKAGDVISIIGSSGSGKSTFLRCINLPEQPNAGNIVLNGEQLKLVSNKLGGLKAAEPRQLQRMRSRLSMVFQHFNLWSHMSALENVMEPEVMLFDEPTSALDPELVGEVLKVMQDLALEGRTMVVVTHEMGFAREVSNQLVFLHKGQVEERGDPREVLVNPQSERLQQFLAGSLK